jgi:hypothetical protein
MAAPDNPTLGSLLATAAHAGTADIAGVPLQLATIAALYTAVTEDRRGLGLFGINRVDDLAVRVDGQADPETGVEVLIAHLRYLAPTTSDPVERLCLVAGCGEPRLGRRQSTAFCYDHITGGEDEARRLDTLQEEADVQRREGEGLARVVEGLRSRT